VTQKLKNSYNYLKGKVKGVSNFMKGVSAGGEEFTLKLDKVLTPKKKKGESPIEVPRPKFLHGRMI
jgi:hypothetical protein